MENSKCFITVTIIALVLTLVIYFGLPKAATSVPNINPILASSAAWFQEIQRVKNMTTDNRFGPSHSVALVRDGVYRDTFTPKGPPVPTYDVDLKNFGLIEE